MVWWWWNPLVFSCLRSSFFFKVHFIDHAITVVPFFSPLYPAPPCTLPFPPVFPPLGSCPWVVHTSSLASPFPILFFTSPCLFSTYHLCFLFPVPFPHSPQFSSQLITLQMISIVMICSCSGCLHSFFVFFFLDSLVDSWELLPF